MPARPTQPFRDEHRELMRHVEHLRGAARELPRLSLQERDLLVARIAAFLRDTLLPHARAEEEVLYPAWARLVGDEDAAIPMVHDHEAIAERVRDLERAGADDVDRLQELLYGLHALLVVHFEKEEAIQLPALDEHPDVARDVLARMEARTEHHVHA
ncbi:MAG TPA: hemerythrin domain-containing protein [Solirubrobacteraceae bacterium]|nr:hemerythrin domain-containing protein [Solirubrobacteraceae bacterium]